MHSQPLSEVKQIGFRDDVKEPSKDVLCDTRIVGIKIKHEDRRLRSIKVGWFTSDLVRHFSTFCGLDTSCRKGKEEIRYYCRERNQHAWRSRWMWWTLACGTQKPTLDVVIRSIH